MNKKIVWVILWFLWFCFYFFFGVGNSYALEFQVKSNLDSYDSVQLFWTGWKIGWWWYFFRYSSHYDEAWNHLWSIPWWWQVMQNYNDRKKTVVDTQYYWYYINSSASSSNNGDIKQMVVVDKRTGEIYSKRFTGNFYSNYYWTSSYVPFFFFEGHLILKLWSSNQWYYFDKWNVEFNIEPWIKAYSWYTTSLTIAWKEFYYANEFGSDVYTLYDDSFRGYQFAYDWNGNILRAYTDLAIPDNSTYSRFRIHKSNWGVFYLSFLYSWWITWMKWYDTNSQSWYNFPWKYMLFYNPEIWYGWTVWDYGDIPYYISETWKIASIWKWVPDLNKYVKYYQKTNKSLYTNDVSIPDTNGGDNTDPPNDFSSWSTDTSTGSIFDWWDSWSGSWTDIWSGGTDNWDWGIIDSGSWSSDNSDIIGNWSTSWWDVNVNIDNSWIIDTLVDLFWVDGGTIGDLSDSLSGALDMWTSGFSVGTWWTSWIDFVPWDSDYWVIIWRDDEKLTCDMFNGDWSFAYYSNGSYDLSIDLNGLLDLGYADKVPFLEELLFIPNKILSFITNPLQNIFSTLRVFWGIWENTYCYFGTLQTIEFQKHIKVWTSFWGWELIFIPWTLTIIDYLIMFFLWLPLLILTVRILLY